MAWGGIPLGVSAIIQNMLHCSSSIFRYSHLCSFIASNRCKTDRHTICEGSVAREKIFLRMYEPGGTLKSTSVEWCDGMFNKRHTAALLLTPVSTAPARRLSKVRLHCCIVFEWTSSWSWFCVNRYNFREDIHGQKRFSHFRLQWPRPNLTFWPENCSACYYRHEWPLV